MEKEFGALDSPRHGTSIGDKAAPPLHRYMDGRAHTSIHCAPLSGNTNRFPR
jgi:hypothetical protein